MYGAGHLDDQRPAVCGSALNYGKRSAGGADGATPSRNWPLPGVGRRGLLQGRPSPCRASVLATPRIRGSQRGTRVARDGVNAQPSLAVPAMGRLSGKSVVITGAASGIGAATAELFASEGANLVLGDLNEAGGEATAERCRAISARAVFLRTDVAEEDDVAKLLDRAVSEYGQLDVVFNNAGLGGAVGPFEETRREDWDRTMAVLLSGVFFGIKHAVRHMKDRGGSIISTSSVAGLRAGAGPIAYSVAKAGVAHLSRVVALEVAAQQIRVNAICPGGINTPIISTRVPGGPEVAGELLKQLQPLPMTGQPLHIAHAALFLASDESAFVTGQALVIDGGFTLPGMRFTPPDQRPAIDTTFAGPSFE